MRCLVIVTLVSTVLTSCLAVDQQLEPANKEILTDVKPDDNHDEASGETKTVLKDDVLLDLEQPKEHEPAAISKETKSEKANIDLQEEINIEQESAANDQELIETVSGASATKTVIIDQDNVEVELGENAQDKDQDNIKDVPKKASGSASVTTTSKIFDQQHEYDFDNVKNEPTPEEKLQQAKAEETEKAYKEAIKQLYSSNTAQGYWGFGKLKELANQGHANSHVEIGFCHLRGIHTTFSISTARDIFEMHASNGNPKAQAGLAFLYATGIGTNSSQAKALVYLTFSALGDDPMGRMMLGYRYWAGIGVSKNCEAALNFYKKGAEEIASKVTLSGGTVTTRIRLLDEEENPSGNYGRVDDDLVQYYQFLAEKGDAPAQVTLGQLNYQGGRGFEQNRQKAFEYFEKAAKMGNANAQGYLGKIYAEGSENIKQNNESAIRYFKLSADQANPIGHAGLGMMYLYGKGVKVDYNKAFKHFQSSADQGWPEGQLHLGNMYFHGQGVKRSYQQAVQNFNLAAQNGHLLALYYLGRMYASGTGVARSCRTAVELYKNVNERGHWATQLDIAYNHYKQGRVDTALSIYLLLAELGYEVAQSNVAYILDREQTTVLNQSLARALIHWDRAASQGYVVARIKLGDYHYYGKGTEVDYEAAATHYKEASDTSSNAQALFNLGYMHEQGLGMKRDIHLAKRQYDLAAEASPDAVAPVNLALIKLTFLYFAETIQTQRFLHTSPLLRVTSLLPEDWDIYVMTLLALMLGFVVAFRRQMR